WLWAHDPAPCGRPADRGSRHARPGAAIPHPRRPRACDEWRRRRRRASTAARRAPLRSFDGPSPGEQDTPRLAEIGDALRGFVDLTAVIRMGLAQQHAEPALYVA